MWEAAWMGDYRSVTVPNGETAYLNSMGYEFCAEQAHWGPCRRNNCYLHYVTKGKGWFCGSEVHSGQGFYIHAGQMHEYHADERDGWNYLWISFSEDLAKKYVLPNIDMDGNGIFEADYTAKLPVERQKIFAENRPMKHLEALSVFFSILALHEADRQPMESMALAHLNRAKTMIENSFAQRLTVADISREIAIDDRYLYNLFRKYEGMSVKAYIDRCTVNNACALLTGSDMSISQIALRLGFDDVYTFSRFFRKHTGVSPTHYRIR